MGSTAVKEQAVRRSPFAGLVPLAVLVVFAAAAFAWFIAKSSQSAPIDRLAQLQNQPEWPRTASDTHVANESPPVRPASPSATPVPEGSVVSTPDPEEWRDG